MNLIFVVGMVVPDLCLNIVPGSKYGIHELFTSSHPYPLHP
jgi:hypothetical protein